MKCPLQIKTVRWEGVDQYLDFFQCDPDCAWYDQNNKCCIIQTLSKNLSNIKVSIAR